MNLSIEEVKIMSKLNETINNFIYTGEAPAEFMTNPIYQDVVNYRNLLFESRLRELEFEHQLTMPDNNRTDERITQLNYREIDQNARMKRIRDKHPDIEFPDSLTPPSTEVSEEKELEIPNLRGVNPAKQAAITQAYGEITDDNYDQLAAELELLRDEGLTLE